MTLRQWKRPRNIRKRFLRRMSEKTSSQASPSKASPNEPAGRVRRSLEKLIYVPKMETTTQPPTYAESVDYSPPLHPPPTTEKQQISEKQQITEKLQITEQITEKQQFIQTQSAEKERGRPRELLYKLQLNDIMLRRPRRPSPGARRPIKPADVDFTNYGELLYCQSRATVWMQGFDFVRWATLGWLVFVCFMLALAW